MKPIILSTLLSLVALLTRAQTETRPATIIEDFGDTALLHFRYGSTGTKEVFKWKSGVPSAIEPGSNILLFKIDPNEKPGAGRGPEIISKDYTHFGSYSARLKVPDVRAIQPNAGAVVGYFTYNVDSVPGLSEIDFEWLIADPTVIYIGTWTGQNGKLQRIGRTINMAKGIIYNTIYKENHNGTESPLTGQQNQPTTIPAIKGYDASKAFYTYGFDWFPDRLRWWIMHPTSGEKIVLWDYQGSPRGIPQNHSLYRMNFWHSNEWSVETNPKSIERPLHPYELEVDWMSYSPF